KLFVLTYIEILNLEQRSRSPQSTPPEKLGHKEDPKREIRGHLGEGERDKVSYENGEHGEGEGVRRNRRKKRSEEEDMRKQEGLIRGSHW
ncbi:hypothetical protein ACQP3J_29145, partial [Escherichia coli]